jgi:hypothetical protein
MELFMKHIRVILLVFIVFLGCDMFIEEIPPEDLPSIPDECSRESNILDNALFGAYTSAKVSQMQITRVTNQFAECLKNSGLSRAEVKGIIDNKKKTIQEEVEKGGGKNLYVF